MGADGDFFGVCCDGGFSAGGDFFGGGVFSGGGHQRSGGFASGVFIDDGTSGSGGDRRGVELFVKHSAGNEDGHESKPGGAVGGDVFNGGKDFVEGELDDSGASGDERMDVDATGLKKRNFY